MPHSYPTDLSDSGLEAYNLTQSSSDLSKRAPSLFLLEGVASRLEIREYVLENRNESPASNQIVPISGQKNGKLSASQFISTVDDLLRTLKVSPGQSVPRLPSPKR